MVVELASFVEECLQVGLIDLLLTQRVLISMALSGGCSSLIWMSGCGEMYLLLSVLAILCSVLSSAVDSALVLRRHQVDGSPLQSLIPQEPHP